MRAPVPRGTGALRVQRWWSDPISEDPGEAFSVGGDGPRLRCSRWSERFLTEAYREHRLVGSDGDRVDTEWGWYERHDPLHSVWVAYEVLRRRSEGYWRCSLCWQVAGPDHTRPC